MRPVEGRGRLALMRGFGTLLMVPLVLSCGGSGTKGGTGPRTQLTPKDIVAAVEPGDRPDRGRRWHVGTGFIVDKTGLVATNLHVVVGRAGHQDQAPRGRHLSGDAGRRRRSRARPRAAQDLAAEAAARAPPRRQRASWSAGDQVVAIGNPLGVFENSVSSGLVSQVRPVCTQEQVEYHKKHQARHTELHGKIESFGRCQAARSGDCEALKLTPQEEQELEKLRCREELTILQIRADLAGLERRSAVQPVRRGRRRDDGDHHRGPEHQPRGARRTT